MSLHATKSAELCAVQSGLHFSRTESSHTPVPCRCWQADQVGEGISCSPSLKLKSCYVRPSWFVGSTSANKQDQKERMQLPTLLQARKCSFLACLPSVSTRVRCYKRASLFSFHTHFPSEVFILHFTFNYKKAYRLHADQKRV